MMQQGRPGRVGAGAKLGAFVVLPMLAWAAPAAAEPEAEPPLDAAPEAEPAAQATPAADAVAPAAPAASAEPAVAAAPMVAATPHAAESGVARSLEPKPRQVPRIGAMVDVGAPDGASVSVVYRPLRPLRAYAGLSHNLISLGERVGVTLTPGWWASPTLSLEYGRFAEGNANPLVRAASGDDTFQSAVLERVGYSYANARLGLELGRKWFTFYLHAGMSRISGRVHNLSAATMSESSGTTTVSFSRDPDVRLWTASASLGFIVYLAK